MKSYVEHANISVNDVDEAIRFFTTAMPDFSIRHDDASGETRWVHLGTDDTYIAINQNREPTDPLDRQGAGFNHVGFVVVDADALRERMLAAGFHEGFVPSPHPHRKRVYFLDADGMEYEFVEYLSGTSAERHSYEQ